MYALLKPRHNLDTSCDFGMDETSKTSVGRRNGFNNGLGGSKGRMKLEKVANHSLVFHGSACALAHNFEQPKCKLYSVDEVATGAEAGNKWLLSGGRDRSLWGWSLRRDGQSTELSQGNIRKKAKKFGILSSGALSHGPTTTLEDLKAPEITCIACSLNRDGGIGAIPGKQALWQKARDQKKPIRHA